MIFLSPLAYTDLRCAQFCWCVFFFFSLVSSFARVSLQRPHIPSSSFRIIAIVMTLNPVFRLNKSSPRCDIMCKIPNLKRIMRSQQNYSAPVECTLGAFGGVFFLFGWSILSLPFPKYTPFVITH